MKIAVIQLKQIGDVLLTTTIFKNIKQKYPESEIHYYVYDFIAPLIQSDPNIDKIIEIPKGERKNILKLIKNKKGYAKHNYDHSIDMILTPMTAVMTMILNANNKIALKKDNWINKLFYNSRIERKGVVSTLEKRNALLKGIDENWEFTNDFEIYLEKPEKVEMKVRMKNKGVDFDKSVLAFGVNSRRKYKIWPKEYFVELINYYLKTTDANIVLHNSPNERKYAEDIKFQTIKPDRIFIDIETKNIRELAVLFSNVDIYIGNEGGPRHIAEAVGIPTFTINYLKGSKATWIPNEGERHRVVDLNHALEMTEEEYRVYRKSKTNLDSITEAYKLKPEIVKKKLDKMLYELDIINL